MDYRWGGRSCPCRCNHSWTGLNHANDSKGSTGSNKVTTLKVAHTQNYVPYDFVDEKGESDGYEVAVLKAIDENYQTTSLSTLEQVMTTFDRSRIW